MSHFLTIKFILFIYVYWYLSCLYFAILLFPTVTFYSVPNGPPQACASKLYNTKEVELSWEEPLLALQNGQIIGYNLTCYCDYPCSSLTAELSATQNSTTNNFTFIPASSLTQYTCSLSAINEVGEGPPTQCIFTTLEGGNNTLVIGLGTSTMSEVVCFKLCIFSASFDIKI